MEQFDDQDVKQQKIKLSVWTKIFKVMIKRSKPLILLILSVVALSALDLIYPLMNRYAIDTFFGENPDFSTVWYFIGGYIAIALAFGFVVFAFIKMAGIVEVEVAYELRKQAFNKLQKLSYNYYDKTPAGWIVSRLTSDSRRLSAIISWGLVNGLWGILSMVGILGIMFFIKWQLALIIIVLVPIMFLISMFFRKRILKSYRDVRKTNSQITAAYNEGILGNKTSKTLVLEKNNYLEFTELTTTMKQKSIRAILYSSLFFPVLLITSYTAIVFILRLGGSMVINDILAASTLYLFISYTIQFFDPVMQLANILAELQQAQAAAERIIGLIDEEPQIIDSAEVTNTYGSLLNPKKENYLTLKGDVKFDNVTFSYLEDEIILKNFNLDIKAGMSVALVGSTGSGKSTIVNLVCRFYEPNSGHIYIDGVDYKEISIGNLRSNLGYVLQTPHLFNMSVLDNIRYGRQDASLEEVIEVAKIVGANDFIIKMENGYDTFVGEEGSLLSAGERQLISFARALLVNPRILVLDEATSSIDTKTEEAILTAIEKVMAGRTTFIVAHRLSTIKEVDKILVIDKGEIIEQGSHQELINLQGEYYNLYKNQFINEQILLSTK